jgi:hypothetical protein
MIIYRLDKWSTYLSTMSELTQGAAHGGVGGGGGSGGG